MRRATHVVVTTDNEIDAAILRDTLFPPRQVVSASYDSKTDKVVIQFADGVQLHVPRNRLQGLEDATSRQLSRISIEGPGTGLVWPSLDVAHYVPGLIAGVFGTRSWMAEIGRRGGARRSRAKSKAARANGAKGGRPRKKVSRGS